MANKIYPLFATTKKGSIIAGIICASVMVVIYIIITVFFGGNPNFAFSLLISFEVIFSVIFLITSIMLLSWYAKIREFKNKKNLIPFIVLNFIIFPSVIASIAVHIGLYNSEISFIKQNSLLIITIMLLIISSIVFLIYELAYTGTNDKGFFIGYYVFEYKDIENIEVDPNLTYLGKTKIKITTKNKKIILLK